MLTRLLFISSSFGFIRQPSLPPFLDLEMPQAAPVSSAVLDKVTYLNKGLVGFGLIPSNFRDSTGDTLGGFGSAVALKRGSWKKQDDKFHATLVAHPDRGYNVETTINYQARQHEIDFVFSPYYGSANQDFATAQQTLRLTYERTTLLYERQEKKTTGLDPKAVRKAMPDSNPVPFLDPAMPIASSQDPRLVLDVEGVVLNQDGTYWISDEYGPYIYKFSGSGQLIQTIQPPDAVLPRDASGALNFTSVSNPATGRSPNQGFESLTVDESTGTLYAMLQSATIQDGGPGKRTNRYTRLFAYDVGNTSIKPRLIGEWVVPLPVSSKAKTHACNELHFVSPGVFLALSRDGDGRGSDTFTSSYKHIDLFSIKRATDIHNTKFDDPANPVSKGGVLDSSIVPAEYVPFVDYLNPTQLARFGLHNGDPNDSTLIDSKWESLALAPVQEAAFPNDYFLFTVADNDFMTTQGISLGVPYNAGVDVDNQVMVFRVTLPSVKKGSVERSIGI